MRVALDTSVVVRLILGAPKTHARRARARLEAILSDRGEIIVTDMVLAETYFALVHHYGVPKREAEALLQSMVRSGVVRLEPEACLASFDFAGPGFVDRLILTRHRDLSATTLTLDTKLAKQAGAEKV